MDRCEYITNAFGVAGGVVDEKRAVGSQRADESGELGFGQAEAEQLIECQCGMGSVTTASAQARAKGDILAETDMHIGDLREVRLHQTIALNYQIVSHIAVNSYPLLLEKELVRGGYLQVIVETIDGIEDGLQVMVTVRALADDTKSEVYFAVGVE